MSFNVEIIKDSISIYGARVTTMALEYPRFIHSELMTHRVFSRNASSSRAIPVSKLIDSAISNPAMFVHIGSNQAGMQANEEVSDAIKSKFEKEWVELAKYVATYVSRWAHEYGIHKQVANRALEPWHHIKVVMTSTEWDNFWELRCHKDAMPEMQTLANLMYDKYKESVPQRLYMGNWHLPYISADEKLELLDAVKCSAARCARVSYFNHDGTTPGTDADIALYDRLISQVPMHASPIEHQCCPDVAIANISDSNIDWHKPRLHGNLKGFIQYRKLVENKLPITNF
jgi:thymidylate synthase ThyX